MALAPGSRLGLYEILAPLGAGGMGEVYKARDPRLERVVAIKVLPVDPTLSEELQRRFEREAKAIAQLSHPHICALYDVGREGETDFLVMEFLQGETLADRLARGPLPLAEVLRFGTEIAGAVDAAHRKGIVHRDLKPGNVMLTGGGVKLLDFGLARVLEAPAPVESFTSAPTAARDITREGTLLGTLAYMAPEQLEGKTADTRTDIFALGAVVYEMATGRKAFSGSSQASIVSAIMTAEPAPLSALAPASPPALDRLVRTCLAKNPDDRWQSAADVGKQLSGIAESPARSEAAATSRRVVPGGWLTPSILAVLLLAAIGMAMFRGRGRPASPPVIHASILPPEGIELVSTEIFAGPVEISPDGSRVMFTAHRGDEPNLLWVQSLTDSTPARPLPGTEGAERPFWSPDGRSIGFFGRRSLRRVDAAGGTVFTLARVTEGRGGSWNRDGVILFSSSARSPLYRISAEGGKVVPETVFEEGDQTHRYPHFLPDGKHYLYLARRAPPGAGPRGSAVSSILLGSLGSKTTTPLVQVASNAVYASGYLLYVREQALVAQPFDSARLTVTGEPRTIVPGIRMDERYSRGAFSASGNGLLAYQTGKDRTVSALRWIDRAGKVLGTVGEPAQVFDGGDPNISPDGRRALVALLDPRVGIADIWLFDLEGGTRRRFTAGPGDKYFSAWSPDGRQVAHNVSNPRGGGYDVTLTSATGAGSGTTLLSDANEWEVPTSFSPDGRHLLVQKRHDDRDDLFVLSLDGGKSLEPVAATDALETMGQFSPDGRFIAYVSDESGREEVYVTTYPPSRSRWQVSQSGGTEPRWRRDGRELFFFAPDNRLMAARVKSDGPDFDIGAIVPLFRARTMGIGFRYDVSADGQRFLVNSGMPGEASPIQLLVNWTETLLKP